ncbi:hypothetical protein [Sedimenticola thiotaurini]|uniref:hypothetical protein n=1 Tax=Sedimenticola thiotaurini TaxID=1543721 RepID=UPI0006999F25|nr:hypothetical protein [Sedimenticola thiotaurini]
MKIQRVVVLGLCLLLLAGCATVQERRDRRIADNQELFDSFPEEIQTQIRQGSVEVGFTPDMVRLAWGPPDHVFTRVTEARRATIWGYTRVQYYPYWDRMTVPVYFIDGAGRRRIRYHSVWFNAETQEEYTVARVEFVDGKVAAIEQLQTDGAAGSPE